MENNITKPNVIGTQMNNSVIALNNQIMNMLTTQDVVTAHNSSDRFHDSAIEDIHRSKQFYSGRVLYEAAKKMHAKGFAGDIMMEDVYAEVGITKKTGLRHIAIYERSIGIDTAIKDLKEGIESRVTFLGKKSNSDKKSLIKDEAKLEILIKYAEALQEKPAMSNAFEEVPEFKTAKNPLGDTQYDMATEAQLYADALEYFGKTKIALNSFVDYLKIAVEVNNAATGKRGPWLVSLGKIREYIAKTAEASKIKTKSKIERTKIVAQEIGMTPEEKTDAAEERDNTEIMADMGFKYWYLETKLGYDKDMDDAFFDIVSDGDAALEELKKIAPHWKSMRKYILAAAHPDKPTGSTERLQAMKMVDNVLTAYAAKHQWQVNHDIPDSYWSNINPLGIDGKRELYKEFKNEK